MFSQMMISSQVTPSRPRPTTVVRSAPRVNNTPTHSCALDSSTSTLSGAELLPRLTRVSPHAGTAPPKRLRKLSFTRLLRLAKRDSVR
ncbi:hypothetical protein C8R44DRAFT_210252 [Mycena epipterygia]|nr:hypothetical protein C8R44DRAFT_210252 [Mycena epipterygia]